ncbi:MAG: Phage major capsid protein [Campylobacterota bacterium]|nr:Phage major capsid protein [Campylobacterota bacterium]
MAVKTSVITAVAILQTVDMAIAKMAFPTEFTHNAQRVEFDFYEGTDEIALKGNFAKESNVVKKDGYKTITVNPMEVNESIVDAVINVGKKRIGETIYGESMGGLSDAEKAEIEDDATKYGKLKKRSQRLIKKSMYDVLTTGKIIVSGNGDATDEINYGLTNIIVNDNATAGQYQWNDTTNSFPVEQLEKEALEMGQYAVNTFILGFEARKAWAKHPQVRTTDNTTTGKRANFLPATAEQKAAKSTKFMKYLGQTTGDTGVALDIYTELEMYGGTNYFLDKNYVVGFEFGNAQNGQVQYGAIPVAEGTNQNSELVLLQTKEWIDGEIVKDPAGVKRYYRSSPLPTMNVPKAFISIKATLIA